MFGVLAQLLNWCYTLWPNYLGMVLLFTLILMVLITPFTVKGMRSAAEMASCRRRSNASTPTRATSMTPTSSGAGAPRTSGGAIRRSATGRRGPGRPTS